jgi:RimJ/RimL family protein N-acetyltransferase
MPNDDELKFDFKAKDKPHFYFRNMKHEHIEWARILHNDPEVLAMLTDPRIVSPDEQELWFTRLQSSSSSKRYVIDLNYRSVNDHIGVFRVDQIDTRNKSMCIGLDIHKDHRGQGYAKPIYRQFMEWAFTEGNMNRLWLLVAGYNARAIKLYEGLGFKHEGVQREGLFKDGKYHDYLMMSVLKSESEWSNK